MIPLINVAELKLEIEIHIGVMCLRIIKYKILKTEEDKKMQTRNFLKVGDTIRSSMGIEIKIESLKSGKGGQG